MKKTAIMAAAACAALFSACAPKAAEEPEIKVLQDRVIEITYNTFDFDKNAEYLNKYDPQQMGACSAILVNIDGKVYVGRDYDFYCSDAPAVVIRNNGGKYRTLAIGNSPASFDPWTDAETYKVRPEVLPAAPFLCCDVMSEAGIYAETNIRPKEAGLTCSSTNPGKPRRCTQTFMQTMLCNYGTIDEILEHIGDYDWFDLQNMGFEQSFFLADKSGRSVIVEFGADKAMWQESKVNANFFQNPDLYAIEKIGCGENRLCKELEYLPEVKTEDDIFTMMKKGAYDQFYHTDVDPDFAIPEFYEVIGYDKDSYAADPEGARKACTETVEKFSQYTWEQRVSEHSWESTFITAANITDLYLHVHFSEHYGIDFKVAL